VPPGQQQRDLVLNEVQQFNGVGHPQDQRLQTWDQLVHAELLRTLGRLFTGAPKHRDRNTQRLVLKQVLK